MTKSMLSALAVLACACGEGDTTHFTDLGEDGRADLDQDGSAAALQAATTERQELATLDVGPAEVVFLKHISSEGSVMFSLEETAPANVNVSVMQRLEEERSLTALEVYLALAPPGSSAPTELVEEHSPQARALGREDIDTVLQVSFDAHAPIEKSVAACEAFIYPANGQFTVINRAGLNSVTGSHLVQTGFTNKNVTVGACNEDTTGPIDVSAWWHAPAVDPDPQLGGFSALSAFSLRVFYNWNRLGPETCQGFECTQAPAQYGVWVNGVAGRIYDLKVGELIPIIQ
jgi:hypothetical protein